MNNKDKISDPKELISSICRNRKRTKEKASDGKKQVKNGKKKSIGGNNQQYRLGVFSNQVDPLLQIGEQKFVGNGQGQQRGNIKVLSPRDLNKNNIDILLYLEEATLARLIDALKRKMKEIKNHSDKMKFFDGVLRRLKVFTDIKDLGKLARMVQWE